MDTEEALLREYEKIIDLFMFQSREAWELVAIYMAVQIGLASAIVLLLSSERLASVSFGFSILFLAGAISSLAWGVMQYRNLMWRMNWLLAGLRLERQLNESGIMVNIFETERLAREEKKVLEFFEGKIRFRYQRWWERIGMLRLVHYAMLVLAILWFILFLASLFMWLY